MRFCDATDGGGKGARSEMGEAGPTESCFAEVVGTPPKPPPPPKRGAGLAAEGAAAFASPEVRLPSPMSTARVSGALPKADLNASRNDVRSGSRADLPCLASARERTSDRTSDQVVSAV